MTGARELAPEIAAGIVEVRHWPFVPGQMPAYEDCLKNHRNDARWIAFLDVDEFLFSPTGMSLPEVLRGFDTHPGVLVNWRMYGTNGWEQQPADGLVIENYPMRGPDDYPGNRLAKSIVYPRKVLEVVTPHAFRLRGTPVGEDGLPRGLTIREMTTDLLRINHYCAKSEEEFRRKSARPDAHLGTIAPRGFTYPPDALRDDTILQFAPQVRELLSEQVTRLRFRFLRPFPRACRGAVPGERRSEPSTRSVASSPGGAPVSTPSRSTPRPRPIRTMCAWFRSTAMRPRLPDARTCSSPICSRSPPTRRRAARSW